MFPQSARFKSHQQARSIIFDDLEMFFNRRRCDRSLEYLSTLSFDRAILPKAKFSIQLTILQCCSLFRVKTSRIA